MHRPVFKAIFRWGGRWVPRLSLGLAVLLVLLWFGIVAAFDSLAKAYIATMNRRLNVKLEVGQASLTWRQLELRKMRVLTHDGKVLLSAERGAGDWRLWPGLTGGGWHWLGDAQVDKVDANLAVDVDGKLNWNELRGAPGAPPPSFWLQYRGRLKVVDAIFNYHDERDGGFYYSVDKIAAQADFLPGQPVKVKGSTQDGSSRAEVSGQFVPLQPELDAHLSVERWPVKEVAKHPLISRYVTVARGLGTGHLWLRGQSPSWSRLWKEMVRELKVQLEGAEVVVPPIPDTFKKVRGELRWSAGTLEFRDVQAAYLDGLGALQGRICTGAGGAEGRLMIQGKQLSLAPLASLVKSELRPLKGRVDLDLLVEGFLSALSVNGSVHSPAVVVAGRELRPLALSFQWSGGALHLTQASVGSGEGKLSAEGWVFPGPLSLSGPQWKDVRLMLRLKADNARLSELFPQLSKNVRADGTLSILGSPLDPLMSGKGSVRGLAAHIPVDQGQGNLLLDRAGAILYNAHVDSSRGAFQLPWAFLDFQQRYAEVAVIAKNFALPSQGGVNAMVDAAVTFRGKPEDSRSWKAAGQVSGGQARVQGQDISDFRGGFFYEAGQLGTPGMSAKLGGGQVSLAGTFDTLTGRVRGVATGQAVNLGQFSPLNQAADFLASLDSDGRHSVVRGWLKSPQLSGAGLAFGDSAIDLKAMAWFDHLDPRLLGGTGLDLPGLRGQVALDSHGGRQTVYYDALASARQDSSVRLVGEASRVGGAWFPGFNWLSFPGQAVSQGSPKILEGGARPYHGPEMGLPLQPATGVGHWLDPPSVGKSNNQGFLALMPDPQDRGRYRFRADGLELSVLSQMAGYDLAHELHQKLGLKLLSGGLGATGSVWISPISARMPRGLPRMEVNFQAPWLSLGRDEGADSIAPVVTALSGTLRSRGDGSVVGEARLGSRPFARPGSPGEVKMAGRFFGPQAMDLRVDTQGFPLGQVTPLLPQAWQPFVPTGRVDTHGFHVWGDPRRPALAGDLALHHGRVWLGQEPVDVDEASLKFSSNQGVVRIDDMLLQAGLLRLEGQARRDKDNRLGGVAKLHRIPLSFLDPLGRPWSDLDGEVEAQLAFQGRGWVPDEFFVALAGSRLTYKATGPDVSGRAALPLTIESLVLGRAPNAREGLSLRLVGGEVVCNFPEGGIEATLKAAGGAKGILGGHIALAGPMRFKARPGLDLARWLSSPEGPVFGDGKAPLVLSWQDLSWPLLGRYLTWTQEVEGESTGQLRLSGQIFQTHQAAFSADRPLAEMTVQQLRLSRGAGQEEQTLRLAEPLEARYERQGNETWVHVDPFRLVLAQSASGKALPGQISGEMHLPVTRGADVRPPSKGRTPVKELAAAKARFEVSEMPVDMLAAFFPFLNYGSGMIHELSLGVEGKLPDSQLAARLRFGEGKVGRIGLPKVEGCLRGAVGPDGRYHISLSSLQGATGSGKAASDAFQVYLGSQVSASQRLFLQGGVNLLWDRPVAVSGRPLQPVWKGFQLSKASTLELHAELLDEQSRLLASLLPDSETGGRLSANLDLRGALGEPQIGGTMAWDNGFLKSPWLGDPITGVQIKTRFEKIAAAQGERARQELLAPQGTPEGWLSRYTLDKMEGFWGGRPFQGHGKVELLGLQPTYLNVGLDGKDLPLKVGQYFTGTGDVALRLEGRGDGSESGLTPVLTGTVTVPKGDLTIPLSGIPAVANLPKFLKRKSAGLPSMANWAEFWQTLPIGYAIDLDLGDDVWANFFNSSVRAQGSLKITPAQATGTPVASGELFLSRGIIRIPLYEVNFHLRQGYALFEEDLIPTLENVEADTSMGGHLITARCDGKYPDLRLDLVSNPPLPETEIQRLVGLEAGPQSPGSSSLDALNAQQNQAFLSSQGFTFVSNLLTSRITRGIGRTLFLSEVSFDFLPPSDYLFKVAKSLDDRDTLLFIFSQVVSANRYYNQSSQQYGIEWRFQPNLLTRVGVDNLGQARLWFQGLIKF